ncbi:MAG: hypothetical protein KAV42_02450 [Candidatus Krumholzibacteria bacterium]|nr:hypothetical protein [Candidatus Krumholzibacteria bacterium]
MEIKGMIFHSRKEFVIENFGEEGWDSVVASLSKEDQELFDETILTAKWYPFEVGERLDKAIVGILGGGDGGIFRKIGVQSAQRSLTKVHKAFLTPGDPQAFMKKSSIIYKFYYDTGYREYQETGPNSGIVTTYEAETFSHPDCLTVIGWYEEALRMCGAKRVAGVEEECRAKGGKVCRYRFSWDI